MAERQDSSSAGDDFKRSGTFESPLPVIECPARLLDALDHEDAPSDLYGDVTLEGFELARGTRVRAGSHPVLRGRFSESNGGTRVDYRLGSSKSRKPFMRLAAIIWAIMALSWVVFFVYWLVDPDGIDIGLPRLLLLLGIVVLMGATIAAGRRSDAEGGEELVEYLRGALESEEAKYTVELPARSRSKRR